jgi:hypothetical protein
MQPCRESPKQNFDPTWTPRAAASSCLGGQMKSWRRLAPCAPSPAGESEGQAISGRAVAMRRDRNANGPGRGSSVTLEILDLALVLLCRGACLEGPEVAAFSSCRIRLARIQTILARAELADHRAFSSMRPPRQRASRFTRQRAPSSGRALHASPAGGSEPPDPLLQGASPRKAVDMHRPPRDGWTTQPAE